jgi:hypothetical protein
VPAGADFGIERSRAIDVTDMLVHASRLATPGLAAMMVAGLLIVGCTSGSGPDGSADVIPPSVVPSATASVPPVTSADPSVAPSSPIGTSGAGPVVEPECKEGDWTGGDADFGPEPTGGYPDLVAATRALRGVAWDDVTTVEADRSGVIRDGRPVFAGSWFRSTTDGWLLHTYSACRSAGITPFGPPIGLERDAIVEVVVDGGLRVRSQPTVAADSIKYEPLLRRGDALFIAGGPIEADGYEWYLVQSFPGGVGPGAERGPFGWVAAAGRDGETWIDHVKGQPCPSIPDEAGDLSVLPKELALHCFGRSELAFELDALIGRAAPSDTTRIEPEWLSAGYYALSGDSCGPCGLPIAADPSSSVELPEQAEGRWAFSGHLDDPIAASCRPTTALGPGAPSTDLTVHRCRTTLVLTSLRRIDDVR